MPDLTQSPEHSADHDSDDQRIKLLVTRWPVRTPPGGS